MQRSVERYGPDLRGSPHVQEFRAMMSARGGKPAPEPAQNKYGEIMDKIENNPHPHGDAYMDYIGAALPHAIHASKPLNDGIQK